jgi:hypothetical protein
MDRFTALRRSSQTVALAGLLLWRVESHFTSLRSPSRSVCVKSVSLRVVFRGNSDHYSIHAKLSVPETRLAESLLIPARDAAPEMFDRGLKEGRATTLTEAIHLALDDSDARVDERSTGSRLIEDVPSAAD